MAEYLIQDTTLDAIADAINAKTGGSSAMTPAEMATAIGSISGGETDRLKTAEVTLTQDYATSGSTPASVMALCAAAVGTNNVLCFLSGGTSGKANAEMGSVFYGGFSVQTPALTLSDKTKTISFVGVSRIYGEENPRDALQGVYSSLSYNSKAFAGFVYTVWGWD